MKHENLMKKLCKELETMEEKYKSGGEMSVQDLDKIDKLTHSLKSLKVFEEMEESQEMQSYARRSSYAYGNPIYNSYADGSYGNGSYARGMSREMDPGMSGHYAPYYPERRW